MRKNGLPNQKRESLTTNADGSRPWWLFDSSGHPLNPLLSRSFLSSPWQSISFSLPNPRVAFAHHIRPRLSPNFVAQQATVDASRQRLQPRFVHSGSLQAAWRWRRNRSAEGRVVQVSPPLGDCTRSRTCRPKIEGQCHDNDYISSVGPHDGPDISVQSSVSTNPSLPPPRPTQPLDGHQTPDGLPSKHSLTWGTSADILQHGRPTVQYRPGLVSGPSTVCLTLRLNRSHNSSGRTASLRTERGPGHDQSSSPTPTHTRKRRAHQRTPTASAKPKTRELCFQTRWFQGTGGTVDLPRQRRCYFATWLPWLACRLRSSDLPLNVKGSEYSHFPKRPCLTDHTR